MWIIIQPEDQEKIIFRGQLCNGHWKERRHYQKCLQPDKVYLLYVLREKEDIIDDWKPMEREDILILDLKHSPHGLPKHVLPDRITSMNDLPVILWASFLVDNDNILAKIVRWRFSSQDDDGGTQIWRLPFRVGVRPYRKLFLIFSFPAAMLVTSLYERMVEGRHFWPLTIQNLANIGNWIMNALVGGVIIGLIVWFIWWLCSHFLTIGE